jgi:hypothetical protein
VHHLGHMRTTLHLGGVDSMHAFYWSFHSRFPRFLLVDKDNAGMVQIYRIKEKKKKLTENRKRPTGGET